MEIITAIAGFYVIWDCPECKKHCEQQTTCDSIETKYTFDHSKHHLKNNMERKCEHCGTIINIDSIVYQEVVFTH